VILALFAVAVSLPVAAVLVTGSSRNRSVALVVVLALAFGLVFVDQWDSDRVQSLRESPSLLAAGIGGGLAICLALAAAFRRWPLLFPALVVATLPFRVPIQVGGEEANLLLPLYLVIGAGALASLHRHVVSGDGPRDPSGLDGIARWLRPLLAVSVALFALATLYSDDRSQGIQNFSFFFVPFAVLFVLLIEVEWNRRTLTVAFVVLLVQAFICVLVGFVEYQTRQLLWNEAVIKTNEFHVYFRVNSLFWDPNIYGRYLAVVITVVAAVLAWVRRPGPAVVAVIGLAVLWLALITTFSQSSFLALIAGLAVVAALGFSLRFTLAGLAGLALAGILFLVFAGGLVKLDPDRLNPQTGGRANLVSGGLELAAKRPLLGYGSGSFSVSFQREIAGPRAPVTESHTEPVTIAAEGGLVGLAVYIALLVSAVAMFVTGFRGVMPGLGGGVADRSGARAPPAARAAVFAAFVAIFVHTIAYAGFLDDPAVWVLMAVGYSLACQCRATSAA
jgi:putative inorganic carbon (HCO3(-)) transporter